MRRRFEGVERGSTCGSWLACDTGTSVPRGNRGDAIAGKPAPTVIAVIWLGAASTCRAYSR
ncbi:hypothetical protein C9382_19670 [Pseudomonas aylmerensis]|uniref:Uncharacterized protein n=1 Tax=Pseudomonas aylmerensis TaxID=1869229 RepID=A0A2T4FTG4_9PSED|nr:hypothetical protein C9382_19670 [Pseudomonas aylmerensis]